MYEIRLAERNDINLIYDLISELEGEQLPRDAFAEVFLNNLNNMHVNYYVIINNKKIIGFISIHIQMLLHHAAKIAEIQELIVSLDFRGKGIGKLLFDKAKEISQNNNCSQLEVCCNQKRISSHEFYLNQGMTNHHFKFCLNLK
ncbi:N-acetylglutamate synthase and like acetyltransferase [Gottschalkia purinilytica]|uniref:N-acetylglutamate synthase and like acetyltransferase n=1 Tax=Gottschalkia purinilytica TaxID=1503 RepID=A0A0L0WC94_GOTPU|nr:GNAT family N-acetyltransferase [Gottschalkia purinilytica]KNF09087.1 N-acetylglutamate synthase and like acetyltransferase [Gottschalkia purinilytica]